MLIGDKNEFAVEAELYKAYESLGCLAWGFFVIYINGFCYGVREPDATLLACSYGEIKDRLQKRGKHKMPFLSKLSAKAIVWAHFHSCYGMKENRIYCGFHQDELYKNFLQNEIEWAPDGDEAFDDGSRVLHFDDENYVRLIGYRSSYSKRKIFNTVNEVILPSDKYYNILSKWVETFDKEWKDMRKSSLDEPW